MTESFTRLARDRLQQLTATFTLLRERVRDAVASEMGKALGDALRDLLMAILNRRSVTRPVSPGEEEPARSTADRWDDEREATWDDESTAGVRPPYQPVLVPAPPAADPATAVSLAVTVTRWLLKRRVPIWAGLGVGLVAGLATLSGHPVVSATLAAVAAATELLALTDLPSINP